MQKKVKECVKNIKKVIKWDIFYNIKIVKYIRKIIIHFRFFLYIKIKSVK